MCCCNGETIDHLLLHCPVAGVLWSWIFQAFGVHWALSGTIADLLFSWWNGLGRHSSDIWNIVPVCLMWTIWKERNQRTFEDVSILDRQILEGFILNLFDWSRVWGFSNSTSISDFISSLFLISHDVYPWCVSVHILCTLHFFNIISSITYQKKNCNTIFLPTYCLFQDLRGRRLVASVEWVDLFFIIKIWRKGEVGGLYYPDNGDLSNLVAPQLVDSLF